MQKIILTLWLFWTTVSIYAAQIDGIRVEAPYPVIVYIDGQQMNIPSQSCFIANLKRGQYLVEVYEETSGRRGSNRPQRGKILFKEQIFFSGSGIEEIIIDDDNTIPENVFYNDMIMNEETFGKFYKTIKSAFNSERNSLIGAAVQTAMFTSEQCKRLMELYGADSDKGQVLRKLYPRIVDPQNFFIAVETMRSSTEKNNFSQFIKDYNKKNPGAPGNKEGIIGNTPGYHLVMNDKAFSEFHQMVKKAPFDSDRKPLIEVAVQTAMFTSEQCKKLMELYYPDSDKGQVMRKLYPRVVDPQIFFIVVNTMTFSTEKNNMNQFIKDYHKNNPK